MNYHHCPKVFLITVIYLFIIKIKFKDNPMVIKIMILINLNILLTISSAIILNMPFLKKVINLFNI